MGIGDQLSLIQPDAYTGLGSAALSITYWPDKGSFYVTKLRGSETPLEEAAELQRLDAMGVYVGGNESIKSLLLGPSILGPGLYGSAELPDIRTAEHFGLLRMSGVPRGQEGVICIEMPRPAYRGMGRLLVDKLSATDPPELPLRPIILK